VQLPDLPSLVQAFVDPSVGHDLYATGLHLLPFAVAIVAA
jgi:hypothetical protein